MFPYTLIHQKHLVRTLGSKHFYAGKKIEEENIINLLLKYLNQGFGPEAFWASDRTRTGPD